MWKNKRGKNDSSVEAIEESQSDEIPMEGNDIEISIADEEQLKKEG